MELKFEFKENFLQTYLATALERHHAYLEKERGAPKPWVDNPIFQNYFFCNVFRQYDKCSKWIIDNVVPLVDQDIRNWPLIILYRFISTYEVFKDVEKAGQIGNASWVRNYLSMKRKSDKKIFNGCFIRNPKIKNGWVQTWEVPFYIIEEIIDHTEAEGTYPGDFLNQIDTLENMTDWFSQFSATKGFMGYEYACDFEYTKYFDPIDKFTWCNKGPGAQRGLSWIVYGNSKQTFNDKMFVAYCQELLVYMTNSFKEIFPKEVITMREVEHWLCEFQKYVKYLMNLQKGVRCKFRKYQGV